MATYMFKGYRISNLGYHQPDHCVWWEAVDSDGQACFHGNTLREVEFMIIEYGWERRVKDLEAKLSETMDAMSQALKLDVGYMSEEHAEKFGPDPLFDAAMEAIAKLQSGAVRRRKEPECAEE